MSQLGLTPKEVVTSLDKYIIGQTEAKKAIAVALRNRYRRMQLSEEMKEEITPKNLLMIGPTGVGKTEIARRLATLVEAPFVKVEATKFTEVGYVGRDVESMIRDLVENSITLVKKDKKNELRGQAFNKAVDAVVKALKPGILKKKQANNNDYMKNLSSLLNPTNGQALGNIFNQESEVEEVTPEIEKSRTAIREQVLSGQLDQQMVTIEVAEKSPSSVGGNPAMEQMENLQDMLGQLTPKKKHKRTVKVSDALELLTDDFAEELINKDDVHAEALHKASQEGIIFIDEIDKITSKSQQSGQVSREGVQRDILPIVEGSQVKTKYGMIDTDHILFIGSGAFHVSKPSDLIPELQGRFPIRVELHDLSIEDFERILKEPKNALIKQYIALLETENVTITFTAEGVHRIAEMAYQLNSETENIGARRLHTLLEKLLEDLLFEAPDMQMGEITISQQFVDSVLGKLVNDDDLSHYIL